MKLRESLFIGIIVCLSTISCDKNDINTDIEVTGVIQKQGITTYQYGSHTISGYALRSSAVNLDDYINQNVTVVGCKVDGYPVDGGPDYIEVEEVK